MALNWTNVALAFLVGIKTTVLMVVIAWIAALPVCVSVALWSASFRTVRYIVKGGSVAFSVIPFLVIMIWVHYPLQSILNVIWSPLNTCTVLLSVYIFFSATEILADEIIRRYDNLSDAAKVIGVSKPEIMMKVVFPTSLRSITPRLLTLCITSIHLTMFASLIGVGELFRVTQRLNAELLRPVELFTAMAIAYCVLCAPFFIGVVIVSRYVKKVVGDD